MTEVALREFQNLLHRLLARRVVAVADDHDDAPRLDRLTFHQLAARTRHVDRVVQRRTAARLELSHFVEQLFRIMRGVDRHLGIRAVRDEVAAVAGIVRQQSEHQLLGGLRVGLPVDLARIAHVHQEADDDRLAALASEELDVLFLPFIEDLEVLCVEVRHKFPALLVHDGDRDDDFSHLRSEGLIALRGRLGTARGLRRRRRRRLRGKAQIHEKGGKTTTRH